MVSIAAFQAVDPGSIPGRRSSFFASNHAKVENAEFFKSFEKETEQPVWVFSVNFSFGFPVPHIRTELFSSDAVQRMIKMLLLKMDL